MEWLRRFNMHRVRSAVLTLLLVAPSYSLQAQDKLTILQIFDQFALSNAATGKCVKPDSDTLTRFLANFQTVSWHAALELKKQFPERSNEQIADAMTKKTEILARKVHEVVREKGCADPGVQELIKRFHAQAKWQPGK